MFKKTAIDYRRTGALNALVQDYLDREAGLQPFYTHFPDEAGFAKVLENKPYEGFGRKVLSGALLRQANLADNTSASTLANIESLAGSNSYTVTTGHQLCLFTGPLYFLYKIASTINLASRLKKLHPDKDFIPVYWMASEDHDFAEVNHLHAFGKKIEWTSDQTGAVGDFNTAGLKGISETVKELFGPGDHAAALYQLFEKAYLQHGNLAAASRYLVNALFGHTGLVVADGNDHALKAQFREEFRRDIFEHRAFEQVNDTIKELGKKNYHPQVNPREINCFYIEAGLRARIEKDGENFRLAGTERTLSRAELNDIIDQSPWKLSPNVTLRPLYQQKILPNIAYVGGPGELAYWLEYKKMFEDARIFYPLLVPRNFMMIVDAATQRKIEKLGFEAADFFDREEALIHTLQVKLNNVFELPEEEKQIGAIYAGIEKKLTDIDKTLQGALSAELQKTLKGIEHITAKANKALKQRSETEIAQIRNIRQKLFPEGVPQERHENFSVFYLKYGPDFLKSILDVTDPFSRQLLILTEA